MKVLVGCEESQAVTVEFRKLGHEAYSCDIIRCSGGHPEWHIMQDVLIVMQGGWFITQAGNKVHVEKWDIGIFFPDCTYLTCSAEWAYKEGPYHQKTKPGTLVGEARQDARKRAVEFVKKLYCCGIKKVAVENPVGVLSRWKKPNQTIQPYKFGENASKRTCIWLKNLPNLNHSDYYPPRIVNGKERWGNQTDAGQNKLPPGKDRAKLRSKTYLGIAEEMAKQWG